MIDGFVVHADRAAYLIDGDAYFRALAEAMVRARRCICIAGWDIDARAKLPDPTRKGRLVALTRFLDRLARRNPRLHIYLLGWDFAPLFTLERQPFPTLHLGWVTHERVHFVPDSAHPPGASHHQKIVIVDDLVAFSGGLDLAVKRWDTSTHAVKDERRKGPYGDHYPPFHDVQIVMSGEAARSLGDLFRERWKRACGEELAGCDIGAAEAWPSTLVPDARDADVEVSLTMPAWNGNPALNGVKASLARAILGAKRWIYIENQYLSCEDLASLLASRLDEPDGPEVVVVAPRCCSGWLEEKTMGVLRCAFLQTVRSAKFAAERFRAVYPHVGDQGVFIHAKVTVVDDATARIGSANFSGRSMSLDTECDVALLAGDRGEHASAVASLRNRLLSEHLGKSEAEIAAELAATGSMVHLVDTWSTPQRGLAPLEDPAPSEDDMVWLRTVADPERPLEAARLVHVLSRYVQKRERAQRFLLGLAAVAMLGLVVALAFIVR